MGRREIGECGDGWMDGFESNRKTVTFKSNQNPAMEQVILIYIQRSHFRSRRYSSCLDRHTESHLQEGQVKLP
jgi:hypothetical protein